MEGVSTKINYGLNEVRFPSLVKVGSRYLQTPADGVRNNNLLALPRR